MNRIHTPLEIKNLDASGEFEGYASVFDVKDFDGDVIKKGAFGQSIQSGKMPKMLWQHKHTELIGKFTEMFEDDRGLIVKGRLIMDVQKGREAYALMKEGVLDGMSVGFNITESSPLGTKGREITKLDLWEISLVTWGANPEALIHNVKSIKTIRDFERFLRDSGFSKAQAVGIASRGFKSNDEVSQSDSEAEINEVKQLINRIRSL